MAEFGPKTEAFPGVISCLFPPGIGAPIQLRYIDITGQGKDRLYTKKQVYSQGGADTEKGGEHYQMGGV